MQDLMQRNQEADGLQLLAGTALVATHRPATVLLPLWAVSYSLTVPQGPCAVPGVAWSQPHQLLMQALLAASTSMHGHRPE